jgi:hypothetical protein
MNLDLKRLSLADVRLKIFIEMEIDLKAQFLELLELRKRVRQAEQARAFEPAPRVIAAVASVYGQPLPAARPGPNEPATTGP